MKLEPLQFDQRQYPRKVLRTNGILALSGTPLMEVSTIDVSTKGVCFHVPRKLNIGQKCLVNFDLFLHGKKKRVAATAEVMYSESSTSHSFKTGLQFIDLYTAGAMLIEEFMKTNELNRSTAAEYALHY